MQNQSAALEGEKQCLNFLRPGGSEQTTPLGRPVRRLQPLCPGPAPARTPGAQCGARTPGAGPICSLGGTRGWVGDTAVPRADRVFGRLSPHPPARHAGTWQQRPPLGEPPTETRGPARAARRASLPRSFRLMSDGVRRSVWVTASTSVRAEGIQCVLQRVWRKKPSGSGLPGAPGSRAGAPTAQDSLASS